MKVQDIDAQARKQPMIVKPDPKNLPQHIAIIMDGNGRWAQRQGLPRIRGHQVGVERLEEIIEFVSNLGIPYLTVYAFSKENWKRPESEVSFLMNLLSMYLDLKLKQLQEFDVRFKMIGAMNDLPLAIQQKLIRNIEETKNNKGLTVTFALSYSSRKEITDACRRIAQEVASGTLKPEEISETTVSEHLYTANYPDPDLLIRTSGEMRISNFLLWQISYSELYITDKYWPEFTHDELLKALESYQKRERRFGLTSAGQIASS